jgi:glycosyltransferase involved in cell wall biosynthesis
MWSVDFPTPLSSRYPTISVCPWLGRIGAARSITVFPPTCSARRTNKGSYLAFLGRLTAEKGPETAIRIARAAGMQLRIAAKLPRGERRYFKERLEPQIDGTQIRLIGEVNDEAKQPFLAGAAALLFPIDWPEPFGLVMIEAMACGTPIIAFPVGSVPEVIDEGLTGFVVDDEGQAIEAVQRLREIDRRRVRERFEERFTARRMATDYLSHYQSVVNGGGAEDRRQRLPAGEESAAPAT